MSDKLAIELFFKDLKESLNKCKTLLCQEEFYLEAILLLSCYIGAFANLRYPDNRLNDGEKYTKVVSDYSGMADLYDLVDLLFFYQWPRSDFKNNGTYQGLHNHEKIVSVLKKKYGDEEALKEGERYISQTDFINCISSDAFPEFDIDNLRSHLPLFSLSEVLYRFLRCYAVHNVSFPFINKAQQEDGGLIYRDNHKITGHVLLQTSENILTNLESECLTSLKWPNEL